jgi:hypothetical protein
MPSGGSIAAESEPEIRKFSDRLMVILGQALLEEAEKAQSEGENVLAWQFGALDAMTKYLAGALASCVTMARQRPLSPQEFVRYRARLHQQFEPAVLALLNTEMARAGAQGDPAWPAKATRAGHA